MKVLLSFILTITAIGYVFGYIDLKPNKNATQNWTIFKEQAEKIGDQFMTNTTKVFEMVETLENTVSNTLTTVNSTIDTITTSIKILFTGGIKGPF